MEKRISFYEFQSVKRVAQACDPLIKKRERVKSQIEKLAEEYRSYDMQIKALEEGVTKVLGLRVEDMIKKVIEPATNGTRTAKYLPTERVKYDEVAKQYVITLDATSDAPEETKVEPQVETVEESQSVEASESVDPFEVQPVVANDNFPFE